MIIFLVFFNYRIVTFFSRSGTVGARTVHARSDRGCIFSFVFLTLRIQMPCVSRDSTVSPKRLRRHVWSA